MITKFPLPVFHIANELKDLDGNSYTTVTNGDLQWTIENYRCTKYSDGTRILNLANSADWAADTEGSFCLYDNDNDNFDDYGFMYNGYAILNTKGLPYLRRNGVYESGWRVPTETDLTTLIDSLGGLTVAGGKLKEEGTTHWTTPNTGATDEIGFKALPGGRRSDIGGFSLQGTYTFIMTTTAYETGYYYYRTLRAVNAYAVSAALYTRNGGASVRLVRDV